MDQSLTSIQQLLREIAEHLQSPAKSDKSAAALKLHRIAAIASTLAFTIEMSRQ